MSELVYRLSQGRTRLIFGRADQEDRAAELKAAIKRKYVLLRFTSTRGGTELGLPLDDAACRIAENELAEMQGCVHLEGDLMLDYVPVRVVADLDLATFEGDGQFMIDSTRPI